MSRFINTELKSDSESSDLDPDSEKIGAKVDNELMAKLEKSGSDSEYLILLTLDSKTHSDGTCLGEPLRGFCDVACHFIVVLHFIFGFPQSVTHLKFVFIHVNIAKVSLAVKTLIKKKYYFFPGSVFENKIVKQISNHTNQSAIMKI